MNGHARKTLVLMCVLALAFSIAWITVADAAPSPPPPSSPTCDPGVGSRLWYRDADTDGFGDQNTSLVGCESGQNAPPMAGYLKDNRDCDDANSNVKPGQSSFFTTARANGTYDYDCSGTITKEIVDANATCSYCSSRKFPQRGDGRNSTCSTTSQKAVLTCDTGASQGFILDSACGAAIANNYRICSACQTAGGNPISTLLTKLMGCR